MNEKDKLQQQKMTNLKPRTNKGFRCKKLFKMSEGRMVSLGNCIRQSNNKKSEKTDQEQLIG